MEYVNGLLPGSISADQSGSLDIHAELSISDGKISDGDVFYSIVNDNPQDLSLPAQIPIYYRTGAGGLWKKDAVTNFPVKRFGVNSRLAYNHFTGTSCN